MHWKILRLSQWSADFHLTWFKEWTLADGIVRGEHSSFCFAVGPLGLYEYVCMPFHPQNAPTTFQWLMESCLKRYALRLVYNLLRWYYHFFTNSYRTYSMAKRNFLKNMGSWIEVETFKVWFFFQSQISYLGHTVSKEGIETDPQEDFCYLWLATTTKWLKFVVSLDLQSIIGSSYTSMCRMQNHWIH